VQKRVEQYKDVVDGLKDSYDKLYGTNLSGKLKATAPRSPLGTETTKATETAGGKEALAYMRELMEADAKMEWERKEAAKKGIQERLDLDNKYKEERIKNLEDVRRFLMSDSDRETSDVNEKYRLLFAMAGTDAEMHKELERKKQEELKEIRDKAKEQQLADETAFVDAWTSALISGLQQTGDMIQQIADSAMQKQQDALTKELEARKKNVQDSKMSAKQKEKELLKIDEEGRKAQYELALKTWKLDLLTATAKTGLSIAASAAIGYPQAIPAVIASAANGTVATGIMLANKPKFADGGFVPGVSYTGDKVDARVNSGEAVLNVQQQREFMALANGRSGASRGNITVGETTVIINGNATDETVQALRNENMNQQERILEMLYDAKDRGMIDTTRLTI
jgi:hypothetical protein